MVRERVDGGWYEYVPLVKFVVSAPGVCGGRPTFKYTRIEAAGVLARIAAGHPVEELVRAYKGRVSRRVARISPETIQFYTTDSWAVQTIPME